MGDTITHLVQNRQEHNAGCDEALRLARERAEKAEALAERRRIEREQALNVTTREGLSASEWLMRTAQAEARAEKAEKEIAALHDLLGQAWALLDPEEHPELCDLLATTLACGTDGQATPCTHYQQALDRAYEEGNEQAYEAGREQGAREERLACHKIAADRAAWLRLSAMARGELTVSERRTLRRIRARWRLAERRRRRLVLVRATA